MSTIVRVSWKSLALGTEVRIMAHSTLVTGTRDIIGRRLILAKRPVAENTVVDFMLRRQLSNGLINWDEAMTWMALPSVYNAF